MNYLGHLLLSGENREIRFGNFIGDVVKGKQYQAYPRDIQIGILLHRKIDTFTDHHPVIKKTKNLLNPVFSHYKGVIIDIFFDHFLSKNWPDFSTQPLSRFLREFETDYRTFKHFLPEEKAVFYQKFIDRMFMYNYDTFEGIELTLRGLENRIQKRAPLTLALKDLEENYEILETYFKQFFSEIQAYAQTEIDLISNMLKD